MQPSLPVIVWDVDDVLNNLMREWFEQKWLVEHDSCVLCYEDLVENPPHRILGVSLQAYLTSLDGFRLSERFLAMLPNPDVLAWLELYGEGFHHIALTATPICAASASSNWVLQYFGKWIRSFHFLPSPRDADLTVSMFANKGDYLNWLAKGDVIVEDSMLNADAAKLVGLKAILVPQPWNQERSEITCALSKLIN